MAEFGRGIAHAVPAIMPPAYVDANPLVLHPASGLTNPDAVPTSGTFFGE